MPQANDDLRKAAILIDSLDPRAADSLLEQMKPSQADRIRRALLSLGDVPEKERESVISQFLGRHPRPTVNRDDRTAAQDDSGIEIEESLAARFVTSDQKPEIEASPSPTQAKAFQFLGDAEGEAIAPFLRDENPQAVAVVLAHMPPERAADVLARLSPTQQVEVVRRIVHLDEMSPEVLRDLEQELGSRLFEQVQKARRRTAGVTAMCQILGAADASTRNTLLASLSGSDMAVAQQFSATPDRHERATPPTPEARRYPARSGELRIHAATSPDKANDAPREPETNRRQVDPPPAAPRPTTQPNEPAQAKPSTPRPPMFKFGDLARLSDAALRAVFAPVGVDVIELALAGAEEQLARRIIKRLPTTRAKRLAARLRRPGPMRLSDVERAQQEIARIVERLARAGQIKPPRSRERLAMTA